MADDNQYPLGTRPFPNQPEPRPRGSLLGETLGVSEDELRAAVDQAGSSLDRVREHLAKASAR